jgi:Outer membrane protein beta-barrel domain
MKEMRTFLLLFVSASLVAVAQPVGAGLKLGTTLTDALSYASGQNPSGHNFVVGPYVEVRLPAGFAIEGDALYQSGLFSSVATGGASWQFPIVAKKRLLSGLVRPYLEGGVAFSHITDLKNIPELNHSSNFGIVLGAGLELKVLALRVAPEVRYTGYFLRSIQSPTGLFESNKNQAVFLVGIGF